MRHVSDKNEGFVREKQYPPWTCTESLLSVSTDFASKSLAQVGEFG